MEPASFQIMVKTWILLLFAVPAFANIIGVDSRRSILDRDKRIGLDITDADAARFGKATGYIDCRGRKYSNPDLGSASLVGAEDVLVTNAHLLVDEQQRLREPLEECFFQPQSQGIERYQLSLAEGDYEIVRDWSVFGGANDYAVVRLKKKVEGAKAFPIVEKGYELPYGQSFVAVSAISNRPDLFDPFYAVIQGCQIRKVQRGDKDRETTFLGDCDVKPGQSGSVNLVNLNGEWTAIGMIAGSGAAGDGEEFSIEKNSYSYHVAFQDRLLNAIKRMKGRSAQTSLTP
jgi:hypothetical protein